MAVTWNVDLAVTDLAQRRISVTATRTDDTPEPDDVRTYTAQVQIPETGALAALQAAMDFIFAKYEAEVAIEAQHAALLSNWESQAESYLGGLEA